MTTLTGHTQPVYTTAGQCPHIEPPEPETPDGDGGQWAAWDADHPHDLDRDGHICLGTKADVATIAGRVADGAALLDEHKPGWWQKVDLDHLDLHDCEACILGQLFGHYDAGLPGLILSHEAATACGFAESGYFVTECDYPSLTAEWRRVIIARRSGGAE